MQPGSLKILDLKENSILFKIDGEAEQTCLHNPKLPDHLLQRALAQFQLSKKLDNSYAILHTIATMQQEHINQPCLPIIDYV